MAWWQDTREFLVLRIIANRKTDRWWNTNVIDYSETELERVINLEYMAEQLWAEREDLT